jgi:hypothetical protein
MKINIALECASLEEAILTLGKLAGGRLARAAAHPPTDKPKQTIEERAGVTDVPATTGPLAGVTLSPKTARRQRADKGAKRGPYVRGEPAPEQSSDDGVLAPSSEGPAAAGDVSPPPAAVATPTVEDAQAALEAVFKAKGLPEARRLLLDCGAERLRDLPAVKYAEFIARCNAVL